MQMGEKWKAMTDAQKKPYFELARKFALEHKQALQEHPELTYAPSKASLVLLYLFSSSDRQRLRDSILEERS